MRIRSLRVMEFAGVIVLIVVLALVAIGIVIPAILRAHEASNRASCANNLRQCYLAFKMYADEDAAGRFPPISSLFASGFVPPVNLLCPKYLSDRNLLYCPSDIERHAPDSDDSSYVYLGWAFDRITDRPDFVAPLDKACPVLAKVYYENDFKTALSPEQLAQFEAASPTTVPLQFVQAVDFLVARNKLGNYAEAIQRDIEVPAPNGNNAGTTIHRLSKDVERFLTTDANNVPALAKTGATLPMMLDPFEGQSAIMYVFRHMDGGSNVLFMDGHVEFIRFPSKEGIVNRPMAAAFRLAEMVFVEEYSPKTKSDSK